MRRGSKLQRSAGVRIHPSSSAHRTRHCNKHFFKILLNNFYKQKNTFFDEFQRKMLRMQLLLRPAFRQLSLRRRVSTRLPFLSSGAIFLISLISFFAKTHSIRINPFTAKSTSSKRCARPFARNLNLQVRSLFLNCSEHGGNHQRCSI